MRESDDQMAEVYLKPGEMFLARQPTTIRTILGSCVGITFWCPRLGVGALCHSMLPRCPQAASGEVSLEIGYRYVDFCVQEIARQLDQLGAVRREVQVKVFGGADVLFIDDATAKPSVGRLNYETAIEVLHDEGFAVCASSLGEKFGRKIRFNTGSGEVMLLRLT